MRAVRNSTNWERLRELLFVLPDRPARAKWLTPEQREWLTHRLEFEQTTSR